MNDDAPQQHTREFGFLDNSHRFLREAADKARLAKKDPDQWMFAVSALVQSVELALKAALSQIHPSLIYENIDSPKRTVTIAVARNRLASKFIGKIEFTERDRKRLDRAIQIRNDLTHSDFSVNLNQIEANFHEVFAFLAEFNRRSFAVHMNDIVEPATLVDFLNNRKHHQEMLLRAQTRLKDEEIEPYLIRSCSYCTEETMVEGDGEFQCYLCHHFEDIVECQRCGENFTEDDLVDFSDAFDIDYADGLSEVIENYGYDSARACPDCASEIKQEIHQAQQDEYYAQMMEDEYMDRYRGS